MIAPGIAGFSTIEAVAAWGDVAPGCEALCRETVLGGTGLSGSWSTIEKNATISTLKIMLGMTWRFMVFGSG